MIILAFDSTARAASAAVCDGERMLGLYTVDNGLTQSELLLPMAEELLKSLKLKFSDVELLAASTGPGSFTGVRIGAALVKGLAFGRNIPCVSVSTLDALAENVSALCGILVPCMDARRDQLYTAIYESDGVSVKKLTADMPLSVGELAERLKPFGDRPIYLAGDGYAKAKAALSEFGIHTRKTPQLLITENACSVAAVALKKYSAGEYVSDTELLPTYLRLPQAERERLEKERSTKK